MPVPQNVPSAKTSPACASHGVVPAPDNKEFDHLGPDGLPIPGSIIWPGQVRVEKRVKTSVLLCLWGQLAIWHGLEQP